MKPTAGDLALQAHTPVVIVPRFGEFEPLPQVGHRFLVCADGLYVEVRRPWCYIRYPLAEQNEVAMPFGRVEPVVSLAFERVPQWCVDRFLEEARAASPVETGAVVLWNDATKALDYEPVQILSAGVGNLKAKWPETGDHRTVAIDLHSHGPIPAYFSMTDRQDTGSEVVIAVVVGRLDLEEPEVKVSLFFCGKEVPVRYPAGSIREAEPVTVHNAGLDA